MYFYLVRVTEKGPNIGVISSELDLESYGFWAELYTVGFFNLGNGFETPTIERIYPMTLHQLLGPIYIGKDHEEDDRKK